MTSPPSPSDNLGQLSIPCLLEIMISKASRCLAAVLVLYLVSYNTIPVSAAQGASKSARATKSKGFNIDINGALPVAETSAEPGLAPADSNASSQLESIANNSNGNETSTSNLSEQEAAAEVEEHTTEISSIETSGAEEQSPKEKTAWSLPISGPMTFLRHKKPVVAQQKKELNGSINYEDPYESYTQQIDQLLECAWNRDPNFKTVEKAVDHYRKKTQIVIAESKDAANYVVPFRGFGPSSEAGDIITGEKLKLKSKASAEYARQKQIDELHVKVVSNLMQISMGLGMADQERGQAITASGVAALSEMVGPEEAERTKTMLAQMATQLTVPEGTFEKPVWDVQERQKLHKQILELSLDDDPVIHQIKKHVNKYNHKSKMAMVSSSVIQTVLGAASLTPTFVGPAAKTALVAFVMATGGPEQCKLLKELYLDKRLESRCKALNEEAHMAVDNYQLALLTKNPVLLGYSETLVGQMIGGHHVNEVFGTSLLAKKPASTETM